MSVQFLGQERCTFHCLLFNSTCKDYSQPGERQFNYVEKIVLNLGQEALKIVLNFEYPLKVFEFRY